MRALLLPALLLGLAAPATPQLTTYTNDALHFSVAYPSEFKESGSGADMMSEAKKESGADSPEMAKAFDCVTIPLMVMHPTDAKPELLLILDVNLECLKTPMQPSMLGVLATSSLAQGLQKMGTPNISTPVAYKLADHDAAFVQGSTTGGPEGKTAYAGTSCAAVDQHAICWTAMSQDKTRIAVILASEVTFAGHPPAAIVTAATFAK